MEKNTLQNTKNNKKISLNAIGYIEMPQNQIIGLVCQGEEVKENNIIYNDFYTFYLNEQSLNNRILPYQKSSLKPQNINPDFNTKIKKLGLEKLCITYNPDFNTFNLQEQY
jgi:hypothetical protein